MSTDLAVGDHVVMVFMPSCGHCVPCAEGRPALCEPGAAANGAGTLLSGARRLHCDGVTVNHHLGCSAFADHAVVSRRSLVKIDARSALGGGGAVRLRGADRRGCGRNTAKLQTGQSVAVIGLGGVGLASLLGAVAAGARRVVALRPVRRQARPRAPARRDGYGERARRGRRGSGSRADRGRRRCRDRDGRIGAGARPRLPDHKARRHHRDRRLAPADRDLAAADREPGGRGTHGEGQLYRHLRAGPRSSSLHRTLSSAAGFRWTG